MITGRRKRLGIREKSGRVQGGAGTFIVGRNQRPTRFHHTVDAVTLANAARGEGEGVAGADTPPLAGGGDAAAVIDHRYVLRPDFHITVRLPTDLTKTEATRLAEFIRTLPFA
ncbi:MAG TPA: hypothetical protein VEK57_27035 [Thermoanaerobaculia bacterium]|nr:hypothetical protein [Thermoanaerobaculia bacterium]